MPTPVIRDEYDLGLPHLGPAALGDSPLLKHFGHLRWLSFEKLAGVPTAKVADSKGRRLYATFYYIDIAYPETQPANAFRENDRIVVIGDLSARGRNILDGYFAIYRAGDPREQTWAVPEGVDVQRYLDAGIPCIRLSNIFIQQEQGPEKLRIGQPANADFSQIHALSEQPDGNERNREAKENGHFFAPPAGSLPAVPVKLDFEYIVDPDRDVNAAGLVYFANFPAFFEFAERRILGMLPGGGMPKEFIDRRGTLRRQIAFFGNARANDRILLHAKCAISPEPIPATATTPPWGVMWFTVSVERASDQHTIAMTTARRVVSLGGEGDVARWAAFCNTLGAQT